MRTAKALATTAGWSSLQRPLYSPGLLLEDEDLTAGVDYARDMMRLMFRSLLGCGVICGLEVGGQLVCRRRTLRVTIGGGLALDCAGNPIHVQKSVSFDFEPDCDEMPETIWVAVCYVEKCCRPRDISCAADGNGSQVRTRTRDGFEINLYAQPPKCACSCEPPPPDQGNGATDDCCDEEDAAGRPASEPVTRAAVSPETEADPKTYCGCYEDHMNGECPDGCGCRCVVIGKIYPHLDANGASINYESTDNISVKTVVQMRREIRPLLTGWWKSCVLPGQSGAAAETGPAAPRDRNTRATPPAEDR